MDGGSRLLILALTLILIPPFFTDLNMYAREKPLGYGNEISITGDDNLTQKNGITRGSGTSADPFFIENLTISVTDNIGISISSTNKYIVIENCTLIGDRNNYGISLSYVNNITITNCSLSNFRSGIIFGSTANIIISNSSVIDCSWSYIWGGYSTMVKVENLTSVYSFLLENSENISIMDCNFSGYLSLDNVSDVRIIGTEASMGFYLSFSNDPVHVEFKNDTVKGEPVWFALDKMTTAPAHTIGQILFINISDLISSETWDTSIFLVLLCRCNNITLENKVLINTTIQMDDCEHMIMKDSMMYDSVIRSSGCYFEKYTGCSFYDSFNLFDKVNDLFIYNCSFFKAKSGVSTNSIMIQNSKNISFHSSSFRSRSESITYGSLIIDVQKNLEFVVDNCTFNSTYMSLSEGLVNSFTNNVLNRSILELNRCRNNSFYENIFINPDYTTLVIQSSYDNLIFDNVFIDCACGIYLFHFCPGTIITRSYFIDNLRGISLTVSEDCLIYDNYFDNEVDISPAQPASATWSRSVPGKKNIVNGPNVGGNYWKKYEGQDKDYDGFGDTDVPYGPGDEMPLIDLRSGISIEDLTHREPSTGDQFEVEFECQLLYPWVTTGYELNISYNNYSGIILGYDLKNGTITNDGLLSICLDIPGNASKMVYTMKVEDKYGKRAITNNSLIILDKIAPSIRLMETSDMVAGEDGWLRLDICDNFALKSVKVTVASNERDNLSNPKRVYRTDEGWMVDFSIAPSCDRIMFTIDAMDVTGLSSSKKLTWMPVVDIIEPVLEFLSPNVAERCQVYDLTFKASDNFDIRSIVVCMSIDGVETSLGYERTGGNIYSSSVYIFDFQGMTSFKVSLEDYQGNRIERTFLVQLKPLSGPIIGLDPGNPTTGDMTTVALTLLRSAIYLDKIGLSFEPSSYYNPLPLVEDHQVFVPINAISMNFHLSVRDNGGFRYTQSFSFYVIDNDPPVMKADFLAPECGKSFWIDTSFSDNRGLSDRGIIYDHGSGPEMVQVHKDVGSRSFIDIPLDAHFLNITIWAVDHSGNMAYLNHTMVVKDGIPPSILEIVSFQKDRKIFFMVRADDNQGTSDMTCQLVSTNISENMTFFSDGEKFHLDIPLVEGVANFSYKIKLTDRSGNSVISDMRWLELAIDSPSNGTEKVNYFILFIIIMVSLPLVASVLAMFISRIVRKDRNPNIEKNGLKGP